MSSKAETNYETFLDFVTPRVPVHYHTESRVVKTIGASSSSSSSSSSVAVNEEEAGKPYINLKDFWAAYEEWSSYGLSVPLVLPIFDPLTRTPTTEITQYYAPTLSAMQIFTIKPFLDGSSPSSALAIGKDGAGKRSAEPDASSGDNRPYLSPERAGYLYFELGERELPFDRLPLFDKIAELAKQYSGLYSLTSSEISPFSWVAVAWYPIYAIPSVNGEKGLLASFLTYHSLTPDFQGETVEDDKVTGKGASSGKKGKKGKAGKKEKVNAKEVEPIKEVMLPPFASAAKQAYGDAWLMRTSDYQKMEKLEEQACKLVNTYGFVHPDLYFFMKYKGRPLR